MCIVFIYQRLCQIRATKPFAIVKTERIVSIFQLNHFLYPLKIRVSTLHRFFHKHCQRHNGPEGWVLLTKVTSLGHITSSNTNLDQTSSESRPCINFKISIKHHHFDKTKPESRPTMNLIAKTKHQQQNNNQTSASKSCRNINFKILNKPWNLVLKVRTKT